MQATELITQKSRLTSRDYFIERYQTDYTSLIDHLEKMIITGATGKEKFSALGLEAGIGKSVETDRIISEYLNKQDWTFARSFLLVKRFIADVERTTDYLNSHSTVGKVALGITYDNWKEIQKNLSQIQEYPVVVITHSRYFRLCMDDDVRSYFDSNRHTLIIDEQMEILVYSFSEQIWNEVKNTLPNRELVKLFLKICDPLFDQLERVKTINNFLQKINLEIDLLLVNEFEDLVDVNLRHFKGDNNRDKVKALIDFLKCAAKNYRCIYNNGRVSTYNEAAYRWKLSNNLILDANTLIDKRYKHSRDIEIDPISYEKVIDHSNTTLHPIIFNTSRSKIDRVKEPYYEEVCRLIAKNHRKGDNTLIVGHKRHEDQLVKILQQHGFHNIGIGEKYDGQDIAVAHFGAIIGQNYWRDFNKVWVIASPNYPMEVYPLYWAFSNQNPIRNHSLEMFSTKGMIGKYQFKNKAFEEIRHGCLVSDVYQAVKRINREGRNDADIYIVHADYDMIKAVKAQMKHVKMNESLYLDIVVDDTEKTQNPKETKNVQLVQLLRTLAPGVYAKQEIYDLLGWHNNGVLSRYLKDAEIQRMKSAGLIDWNKMTITIFPRTEVAK